MIKNLFIIIFLTVFLYCNTQNEDKIYSFMNNELPNHEFGKSSWGIFLLDQPVILDSNYCKKISQQKLNNIPKSIQQELYRNALELTYDWQQNFRWEQSKMKHDIIITDTKSKISFIECP